LLAGPRSSALEDSVPRASRPRQAGRRSSQRPRGRRRAGGVARGARPPL